MRNLKVFEVIENPWAMIPEEAIRQNLQIMYMFRVADTSRAGFLILRGFNISSGGLFALRVALPSVADLRDINLEENKITDFPTYNQPPLIYNRSAEQSYHVHTGISQLQHSCRPSTSAATSCSAFLTGWTPGVRGASKASRQAPISSRLCQKRSARGVCAQRLCCQGTESSGCPTASAS